MPIEAIILTVAAYLLGAIPFGLLLGKARGVDIREHGSRNIGATNAGRVLGRFWGRLCLALDILKGFAPVFTAYFILIADPITTAALGWWLLIALAAVLGHVFPIYLGFRGGKGVATTVGVALGFWPYFTLPMIAAVITFGLLRLLTGHVSAGSLGIAVVFPLGVLAYLLLDDAATLSVFWPLLAVAFGLAALIIIRHIPNIRRLIRGEEGQPVTPLERGEHS